MDYKNIKKAYKDLYSYTHTQFPFQFSLQGEKINAQLESFFSMIHIQSAKDIENDAKNERMYFGVLYEYLQDLIEDLEDLDDADFEKHKEEYRAIHSLLNLIIASLANETE